MRKIWVATNALLLSLALGMAGVFESNAWAQEGPGLPTVEDPPKSGEPTVEEPTPAPAKLMPDDCFLKGSHFNYLEGQITALEVEAAELRGQIKALEEKVTAAGGPALVGQLAELNQRLKWVTEQLGDTYLAARPWGGWHLRVGALVQGTAFSGADNYAVPLQLDISGEWTDPRNHLGLRFGGALGVAFTEGETSGKTLAPFMVTGHLSGAAAWKYWTVLLPQVRANFMQSPTDGQPGMLWVTVNGGGGFHAGPFFLEGLVGTSVYSTLKRLGGLHGLAMLGFYY